MMELEIVACLVDDEAGVLDSTQTTGIGAVLAKDSVGNPCVLIVTRAPTGKVLVAALDSEAFLGFSSQVFSAIQAGNFANTSPQVRH